MAISRCVHGGRERGDSKGAVRRRPGLRAASRGRIECRRDVGGGGGRRQEAVEDERSEDEKGMKREHE